MSANHDLFVSQNGNNRWSGELAEPNSNGSDGPLASIEMARDKLRQRKNNGEFSGPITVWIRGGRYPVRQPILFDLQDSMPVTYAAYPGENPILDGGEPIQGWKVSELNGNTVWSVQLPEVMRGKRYFRQLIVNGNRRPRARFPKVGTRPDQRNFLRMEYAEGALLRPVLDENWTTGQDAFIVKEGDFKSWENLQDVDVIALHYWIEERMPVLAFDPDKREVKSTHRSYFRLTDEVNDRYARYYIENVFELLTEPGEWYLNRKTGMLYYLPLEDEKPETSIVFAGKTLQFLKIQGKPEEGKYVEFLQFSGLTFENSDWTQPDFFMDRPELGDMGKKSLAAIGQAATHIPGAIYLRGARHITFDGCKIQHIGWAGIELDEGCFGCTITGNVIDDLGAGAIKINGAGADGSPGLQNGFHTISDNQISHGGRIFHSAIGILCRISYNNRIVHNHIFDFFYSGISCGWVWGYSNSPVRNNLLEKNNIHDIGHGWLSDMGAIYILGVQPGTVIRGNLIHDIDSAKYGGWAIYPDEGSAHLIIENNICYRTSQEPFHQHYGRENIIRNNIFAFGDQAQIAFDRAEGHRSFTMERNIILTRNQHLVIGGYANNFTTNPMFFDMNLYWSVTGDPLMIAPGLHDHYVPASALSDPKGLRKSGKKLFWSIPNQPIRGWADVGDTYLPAPELSFAEWQALGQDVHSIVADPMFGDAEKYDFSLAPESPAYKIGFQPIDLSDVGPRRQPGEPL